MVKKARGTKGAYTQVDPSVQDIFEIIYQMQNHTKRKYPLIIKKICAEARVSTSGYYAYLKRRYQLSEKEIRDRADFELIKEAYEYKSWKKGAKQIKMRLKRDKGIVMNLKKIRRLMKKYDLICPIRRANPVKAILKKQQVKNRYDNVLNRGFNTGAAKKAVLTDITYLTYGNDKKAYLSVMKDATTKMILSWQISQSLALDFVEQTIVDFILEHGKKFHENILVHSDQGCHYTSHMFQNLLKEHGIIQSMSNKGVCWDNAPQESFFAILKTEMDLRNYNTYEKVSMAIAEYIGYYNYDRPQEGLHKMTPYEYDEYLTYPFYHDLQLPMII